MTNTTPLSTEARASVQAKIAAILEVAYRDKPLENLTRLLTRATEDKMTYLPIVLQARVSQLFHTDLSDIQAKLKAEFEKYYRTEHFHYPAPPSSFTRALEKGLPLQKVISSSWLREVYVNIMDVAKKVGWSAEFLHNIRPLQAGDLQVIFVGDQHDKIVEQDVFGHLLALVQHRSVALHYEPLPRDPVAEKQYRAKIKMPTDSWLFGLGTSTEIEDLYFLVHNYSTLLGSRNRKGIPEEELKEAMAKADGKSQAEVDPEAAEAAEKVQTRTSYGIGDIMTQFLSRMSYVDSFKPLYEETAKIAQEEAASMATLVEQFNHKKQQGLSQFDLNLMFQNKEIETMVDFVKRMALLSFSKNVKAFSTEEAATIQALFDMNEFSDALWKNYQDVVLIKRRDKEFVKALLDPSIQVDPDTVHVVWVGYKHLESLLEGLNAALTGAKGAKPEGKGDSKAS